MAKKLNAVSVSLLKQNVATQVSLTNGNTVLNVTSADGVTLVNLEEIIKALMSKVIANKIDQLIGVYQPGGAKRLARINPTDPLEGDLKLLTPTTAVNQGIDSAVDNSAATTYSIYIFVANDWKKIYQSV